MFTDKSMLSLLKHCLDMRCCRISGLLYDIQSNLIRAAITALRKNLDKQVEKGRIYQFAILCFARSGGILAFLFQNWEPSKIFMGDTGSLVIGTLYHTLSIIE
jgi:UDP-N-acetylmuramyl pentapeptide phosphotransferase/UDP-N-acetylglucosamine-1-phosphate transferase